MAKYTVYYDSGTSNSRIYLLDEKLEILYSDKKNVGSRDSSITGSNLVLIEGLKELFDVMLSTMKIREEEIGEIYASGMVTSPYGLLEVPHCVIPISVEEFAGHITTFREERLFHRDIQLIPGLKTIGEDITFINNMRGEEIEIIGLMDDLAGMFPDRRKIALILPGSHTHTMLIENCSRVTGVVSQMTGELFHAIREETILSAVLRHPISAETLDEEMVLKGKHNLNTFGFNRAVYICHAMRIFETGTPQQRVSYAEGVINGDLANALDWYCKEQWQGCETAVIASDELMYKVIRSILSESSYIRDIRWIPIRREMPFSVSGLKKILSCREAAW